jgi:hypothetical protein
MDLDLRNRALITGDGWKRTQPELPEALANFEQNECPRGRPSSVEEIADALMFLASPHAMGTNAADFQVGSGQCRWSLR